MYKPCIMSKTFKCCEKQVESSISRSFKNLTVKKFLGTFKVQLALCTLYLRTIIVQMFDVTYTKTISKRRRV